MTKSIQCWDCEYDALPGDILCGPCRQYADEHPVPPPRTMEEVRAKVDALMAELDAIIERGLA